MSFTQRVEQQRLQLVVCRARYVNKAKDAPLCPAMALRHDSANTAAAYAIDSVAEPLPACRRGRAGQVR